MSPVIFKLGNFELRWYSVLILVGVFIAYRLVISEARRYHIKNEFIFNMMFWALIMGILGARIYYVIFEWNYYKVNILEIFKIWKGGLAIHGGLIAGGITIIVYCKRYRADARKILDIVVPGLILAQAIGRWGNFFNGEAFGPATTLETLQKFHLPEFIINGMNIDGVYHVPTFLMESIWTFICFIVLLIVRRYKYLKTGMLTGLYFMLYSLGRFFIEGLRTDSLYLGNLRIAQVVSVVLFIVGLIIVSMCTRKGTKLENLYSEREEKTEY